MRVRVRVRARARVRVGPTCAHGCDGEGQAGGTRQHGSQGVGARLVRVRVRVRG